MDRRVGRVGCVGDEDLPGGVGHQPVIIRHNQLGGVNVLSGVRVLDRDAVRRPTVSEVPGEGYDSPVGIGGY